MRMAVQKKIVLIMSLFALIAAGGLAFLRYSQMKTLGALYRGLENDFDTVAAFSSGGVKTLVNDYSYWDDLVGFLKNGDTRWAQRNFVPALNEFKANAVWIYRVNGTCAYAANTVTPNSLQELPVPPSAFNKMFAKSRSCRFFVTTPQGVMEVQGATIHPTTDPLRKTDPQGYLLAGKLWDSRHVSELAAASGSTVSLARSSVRRSDSINHTVIFSRPLRGWNRNAVMFARVGVQSVLVSSVEASLNRQFYPIALATFAFLAVLFFLLDRWVTRPLNLIYGALDSEDASRVDSLLKDKSEFGYIASLIQKAFEQKAHLLAETLQLREAMDLQKKEGEKLLARMQEFTAELNTLKEKYRSEQEARQKNDELFATSDFGMLKLAYDDLDRKFQEQRTKLHVVSELLQREIIKSHEHYKAEMVAAYQREQALKELNRLTEELGQQRLDERKDEERLVVEAAAAAGGSGILIGGKTVDGDQEEDGDDTGKRRSRRRVLGTNMPKINYTEAQC